MVHRAPAGLTGEREYRCFDRRRSVLAQTIECRALSGLSPLPYRADEAVSLLDPAEGFVLCREFSGAMLRVHAVERTAVDGVFPARQALPDFPVTAARASDDDIEADYSSHWRHMAVPSSEPSSTANDVLLEHQVRARSCCPSKTP